MLENMILLYKVFTALSGYGTTLIDPVRYLDRQNIVAIKVFARVVVVIGKGKANSKGLDSPSSSFSSSVWWAIRFENLHLHTYARYVLQ